MRLLTGVLLVVGLAAASTNAGTLYSENFETMPSWDSSYNTVWGGSLASTILGGGESGNYLKIYRDGGSSSRVLVYDVGAVDSIDISLYMKCANSGVGFWMETAYKLGSNTAEDFDAGSGWTMVKKFDGFGLGGNGDTWVQYSTTVGVSGYSEISIGIKAGSSFGDTPSLGWDSLVISAENMAAISGDPINGSILDLGSVEQDGGPLNAGLLHVENTGNAGTTLHLGGFAIPAGPFYLYSGNSSAELHGDGVSGSGTDIESFLFQFDPTGLGPGMYTRDITLFSDAGDLDYTLQATVTPEPATMSMLALGLGALAARCKRRSPQ